MTNLWEVQFSNGFIKHAESKTLLMGGLYESGYLFHLDTREGAWINNFYGDPTCAVISQDEEWAAMGGYDTLTIWKPGTTFDVAINYVFALRQTGPVSMQILTDPWREDAAIWELNVATLDIRKVRPFPDYIDQAYTDDVNW
ncbi:MAG: hypothetical protein J7623_07890 [Chitinophaga sp.]|uniref:hypothetical protein n=1 Tax=Chitinophaga sp. TaxID=1869181 RepID=UPI001B02AB0E|nr:hypothetical protein [Chitinophaga sp.]MBO9728541.1 hypothetical protein [Chitinophaga sp.]